MRLLLCINIILIAFTSVWCQDPFVNLEITPATVEKGQPVTLIIKSNVDGNVNFELPDEFVQSGPTHSGMSSSVNYSDGKGEVVQYNFQKFSGYFEKEGKYEIGPVKVHSSNGLVQSDIATVKVVKRQNMISKDPSDNMNQAIFGILEQSKKEIYEGQPLILEGKVYAQIDVLQVESYKNFKFEGPAEVQSLHTSNQVSRKYEIINGKEVMTFKIGRTLVFPDQTGNYEISPFEIVLLYDDPRKLFPERAKVRSNSSTVKIKPLPDGVPASFIGAVGSFNISASINNDKIEQGKVMELSVQVSGQGNLQNIEAPKLKLPKGMILYGDPEVSDSITYSSLGAEGSKTFTFYIQANVPGKIEFEPVEIAYFDIDAEKYRTIKSKVKSIDVEASDDYVAMPEKEEPEESDEKKQFMPYIADNNDKVSITSPFSGWKGKFLFVSPLLLGLFFGFAVRKRKSGAEDRQLVQKKEIAFKESISKIEKISDLKNQEEQISVLYTSLVRFLSEYWSVDRGNISRSFLADKVKNGELTGVMHTRIVKVLDELDQARYSYSAEEAEIKRILAETKSIMEELKT